VRVHGLLSCVGWHAPSYPRASLLLLSPSQSVSALPSPYARFPCARDPASPASRWASGLSRLQLAGGVPCAFPVLLGGPCATFPHFHFLSLYIYRDRFRPFFGKGAVSYFVILHASDKFGSPLPRVRFRCFFFPPAHLDSRFIPMVEDPWPHSFPTRGDGKVSRPLSLCIASATRARRVPIGLADAGRGDVSGDTWNMSRRCGIVEIRGQSGILYGEKWRGDRGFGGSSAPVPMRALADACICTHTTQGLTWVRTWRVRTSSKNTRPEQKKKGRGGALWPCSGATGLRPRRLRIAHRHPSAP
jgi:hypothetical protein